MPRKKASNDTTIEETEQLLDSPEQAREDVDPVKSTRKSKKPDQEKGRGAFWISSGSDLMDEVVGGGRGLGYETGMSVLFEAQSSAGKSFLAHEVIASAYHTYKEKCKWLYLDCESGCTFDSKALYGIEIMPPNVEDRKRPKTIEDCLAEIMLFGENIKEGEFGIAIVDSIDGLVSEDTQERVLERTNAYKKGKEYDKGSYGMAKARFLSQEFFPTVNEMVERKNVLLILVSQYRSSAGQYGPKKTISNGDAIGYYCHARVKFAKKSEIEIRDRSIGCVVETATIKMKGPRPYRSCLFTMHYTRGVDNITSNIDFLYDLRTKERGDLKKGAETDLLRWEDDSGVQELSRYDLVRYIESSKQEALLKERVIQDWEAIEKEVAMQLSDRKSRYE